MPDPSDPEAGIKLAAASLSVTVAFVVGTKKSPISEKKTYFCPPGPTRSISRSLVLSVVRLFNVSVTDDTGPTRPATEIFDWILEGPLSGMFIAAAFENTVSSCAGAPGLVPRDNSDWRSGAGPRTAAASRELVESENIAMIAKTKVRKLGVRDTVRNFLFFMGSLSTTLLRKVSDIDLPLRLFVARKTYGCNGTL